LTDIWIDLSGLSYCENPWNEMDATRLFIWFFIEKCLDIGKVLSNTYWYEYSITDKLIKLIVILSLSK